VGTGIGRWVEGGEVEELDVLGTGSCVEVAEATAGVMVRAADEVFAAPWLV
jgi:hypothetical protein